MPRKRTVQPEPSESFTLDDGTIVEVRNHNTREIGRGLDKKFNADELDWQVLLGLFDDLQSQSQFRQERAKTALESNHALARFLLDNDYEMDQRTATRHGKSIRIKFAQSMEIYNNNKTQNKD